MVMEVVALLLERGADVDASNKAGWTPLIAAVLSGHTEVVRLLLERGADPHAAVTSVEIGVTSMPSIIMVDRPFVFAIREKFSSTILFMGRIMNPVAGGGQTVGSVDGRR
jgi:ankyrin repeat protein